MSSVERETRSTENRLILLQWGVVAVFVFLLYGFWRLQISDPEYYSRLAEQNYIKSLPVPAPRGRILDREGRVLVDNYPSFSILAQSDYADSIEADLPAIARGLGLQPEDIIRRIQSERRKTPYGPIILLENASRENIAFIESHRREFPGLDLITVPRRLYPPNGFGAHFLGYMGEISGNDLERPEWALMRPGSIVGKAGIERQYDSQLRGQDGQRRVVVDNLGREAAVLDEVLPVPGKDLRLTIDYDLQSVAEAGFKQDQGAVVALDPRTGGVLAMVSKPSFDPNIFATGISAADWTKLVEDPSNPLLNRAIQAQLAPGSVYKILMSAAALESNTIDTSTTFYCPGSANFYGRTFRCWQAKGHGRVNVHQAIVHSCDVFFYNVGKDMGIDLMAQFSQQFGLGRPTGIDLPNESAGTVPSPEWKEKLYRQKWFAGETISVAIGQGALTVTPLQLAYAVSGIANGGFFPRPHLVERNLASQSGQSVPVQDAVRVALKEETIAAVTDGMWGVVNEGGTGASARVPGLDIAGKTGSAQVASNALAKSTRDEALKDNGWFVGLAPRRNPEIVVAVLYQGGEHGALAAPLARDIIKAYYDKKKGIAPQLPSLTQAPETSKPGAAPARNAG